jgi:hypothetical protein
MQSTASVVMPINVERFASSQWAVQLRPDKQKARAANGSRAFC